VGTGFEIFFSTIVRKNCEHSMTPEEILRSYETKINLHRFAEVAPLISDEAVFWFSDGSHKGKREIKCAFEKTWQKLNNDTYWLQNIEWIALGDRAASCIYQFNWKTEINGKALEGTGRGTTVLRKEDNGWRIVHEHLSRTPK
jgi:ketosteroid isomerase-like protein